MHCTVHKAQKRKGLRTINLPPQRQGPRWHNNPYLPYEGKATARPHPKVRAAETTPPSMQHGHVPTPAPSDRCMPGSRVFPSLNGPETFPLPSNAAHTLQSTEARSVIGTLIFVTVLNPRLVVPLQSNFGSTQKKKPHKTPNILCSPTFPVGLLPW